MIFVSSSSDAAYSLPPCHNHHLCYPEQATDQIMKDYACKRYINSVNDAVSLGTVENGNGGPTSYYCARFFTSDDTNNRVRCGPTEGKQCPTCRGINSNVLPKYFCFNRHGYRMQLDENGLFHCDRVTTLSGKLFGTERCSPNSAYQCRDCNGFSKEKEPNVVDRLVRKKPEQLTATRYRPPKGPLLLFGISLREGSNANNDDE